MPEPNTPVLMFLAYRHAENRILEHMARGGFSDMTLAQARIAARIGEQGTRLTDLAESAQVTKQTAGFLVDQLEKSAYVARVPDPADARARLVRLAARGKAAQRHARKMERVIERDWERHLGADRMAALREALVDLRPLVDPYLG